MEVNDKLLKLSFANRDWTRQRWRKFFRDTCEESPYLHSFNRKERWVIFQFETAEHARVCKQILVKQFTALGVDVKSKTV